MLSRIISFYRTIKSDYHWWRLIHNANDMMLYYPEVKPKDNRVNIHIHDVIKTGYDYYDNGKYPYNLGDVLAMPIIKFMLDGLSFIEASDLVNSIYAKR